MLVPRLVSGLRKTLTAPRQVYDSTRLGSDSGRSPRSLLDIRIFLHAIQTIIYKFQHSTCFFTEIRTDLG